MNRNICYSDVSRLLLNSVDGDLDGAKFSLQVLNFDPNATVVMSPLRVACIMGNYDLAEVLVDGGANVNTTAGSLLIEAIASPADEDTKCKFVELLLSKGVDIDFRNQRGDTALQAAVASRLKKVVQLLIEKGARVFDAESGKPVFEYELGSVCYWEDLPLLEMLFKALPPKVTWAHDASPLYKAIFASDVDLAIRMLKLFFEKGADVNLIDEDGSTLLYAACGYVSEYESYFCNSELVSFLLKSGADVHAVLEDGRTALHVLCADDDDDDDDESDGEGEDDEDASKNLLDCVKALLLHGAVIDIFDDNGCSPLELAVQSGKSEVVDLLLAHKKPTLPKYL